MLEIMAGQAWYIMFPPGCRPPQPNVERLDGEFLFGLQTMSNQLKADDPKAMFRWLGLGRQPVLTQVLQAFAMMPFMEEGREDIPARPEAVLQMVCMMRYVIDELDRTARRV